MISRQTPPGSESSVQWPSRPNNQNRCAVLSETRPTCAENFVPENSVSNTVCHLWRTEYDEKQKTSMFFNNYFLNGMSEANMQETPATICGNTCPPTPGQSSTVSEMRTWCILDKHIEALKTLCNGQVDRTIKTDVQCLQRLDLPARSAGGTKRLTRPSQQPTLLRNESCPPICAPGRN